MEVHHHSHPPGPGLHQGKKKWTHYFWEFLMLFLAVFCGFLAENQREHMIEHKRAKQFALSLLSDVRSDTAALNTAIDFGNKKVKAADDLVAQLEQPVEKWKDTLIYDYGGATGRYRPFQHNSGTYEQIKASGSLRYFKQDLADLLNKYDVQSKKTAVREEILLNYASNIFNPFIMHIIDIRSAIQLQDGLTVTHPLVFRKTDKETIALWINYATVVQSTQQRTIVEYQLMLQQAKQIISELQEKYHLK
jgi:hypothetical protein